MDKQLCRLTFELVQHTPIIHFQSGYEGATLRASEVKPKLDRYLLTRLKEDELKPDWFISQEKGALDYKLSFALVDGEAVQTYLPLSRIGSANRLKQDLKDKEGLSEVKILAATPYFANEEWIKKQEGMPRLAVQTGRVRGEIYTKHPGLRDLLKAYIEAFFLLHNFGARQTKGFGSFTLASLDKEPLCSSREEIAGKMEKLGVEYCLLSKADFAYQMEQITKFHNKLKTGHNKLKTGQRRRRSEIRKYCHKKSVEWEKPVERKLVDLGPEPDTCCSLAS